MWISSHLVASNVDNRWIYVTIRDFHLRLNVFLIEPRGSNFRSEVSFIISTCFQCRWRMIYVTTTAIRFRWKVFIKSRGFQFRSNVSFFKSNGFQCRWKMSYINISSFHFRSKLLLPIKLAFILGQMWFPSILVTSTLDHDDLYHN